ncbi:MAM and LDL-receptor class A domain-containing protein 1-like [Anneissia japonica]|uniref:MAM and LDL-receptor class A domain-containing protein 1-like n=1 Tax=Anneissia japonica TaxID=1529436 RepID=UPI001425A23D|nr:MAM and LDL-receptor class A domain-containing protein 1-like [Anneissia japonica]
MPRSSLQVKVLASCRPVIVETCDIDCLNGGVCVSDYGIENCQCMPGFVGQTCNISQNQCGFEDPHICYFVQDEYDDFDWIRTSGSTRTSATGPAYDHTYGTLQGSYMYIETSYPQYNYQTARLWTLSYPATNGTCVKWFYHMYGATVNTLNVYLVNKEGTVGAPAWTNRNNQGNIWRLGKLSVETKSAFQIMFEGIVGSRTTGDIALDDVRIIDGACLRNAQNQCDFEDPHICYFVQDEYDDFDWIRTSGLTLTSGTGPAYDHTYGTLQGSYMYIETSYQRYNQTARLWTLSYPATNGTCVKWFYHMYGATVNTLNVYIVNTEGTVGAPAWTNRNNQGNIWRLGKLSVETKTSFRIVFEGITGSSYTGDIALDDFRIIDGACLRNETCDIDCLNGGVCVSDYGIENCQCMPGFVGPTCNISQYECDFEDPHICYFEQDKHDDFDWRRRSGSTYLLRRPTGPIYDHTYGTLQGSYMCIETYSGYNNQTSRLWTLSYPATNGTCVKWFYHMYGATVNTLNVYIVNTEGTLGAPAWTNRNNQGNIWRLGKLSVETKTSFRIVFEGITGSSYTGDIALDDFRIIDGACLRNETCDIDCLNGGVCVSDYGIENCQCMPGFVGPTCNISQNQCDFEDPHICYFVQDEYDDFDWIRTSGSTLTSGTGPAYDHTYGTLQGSYMYIDTYPGYNNKKALLWTLSYPATNGTCVKWFYHMYGATVNTLNVYIVNTEGTIGAPAWTNRNNQGNIWRLGKLSVETKTSFQIVFEGIGGSSYTGDIALDDFRIIDGACLRNETCDIDCLNGGVCVSDFGIENCQCMAGFFGPTCNISQKQCDFEDPHICYLEQDENDDFDWIRRSGSTSLHGTGPAYDHTYGTLHGFYIYIESSDQNLNDIARIWTTLYPATKGTCVQWYYHMNGETVNTLNVYIVNTTSTVGTIAWTNRNNQENSWRLGQISVETKSAFQIMFEGIVGSSYTGDIALDDITITDGICFTNDNEAPIITFCPLDAYLLADKTNNTAVAVWNSPAATDNSDVPPYITTNIQQGDLLAIGNHLVSVTVKDSSGNINSSCSFNLTVIDHILLISERKHQRK